VLECFASLSRAKQGGAECDSTSTSTGGALSPARDNPISSRGVSESPVLQRLAWEVAAAALPFLGRSQPSQLRTAAAAAVLAAACMDADAVWIMLYDAVGENTSAPAAAPKGKSSHVSIPNLLPTAAAEQVEKLPVWKTLSSSGSSRSSVASWPVTRSLCSEIFSTACQLLMSIDKTCVAWHERAPVVAPDWSLPEQECL
jgi:hypothetical protein